MSDAGLRQKVLELQAELALKDKDLSVYKEELRAANQHLESLIVNIHGQLKKAMQLQKQIVPTELPHIPGFEVSSKFKASSISGGDYFDIFDAKDKMNFGLLMSSASGYGLSALFLSLFMKFSFESRSQEGAESAANFLKSLSDGLPEQLQSEDELNLFYGLVDRRHMELEYINLGACVVIHYLAKESKLEFLAKQSPSLAAGNVSLNLRPERCKLNPKDKLILLSPGLFQVKREDGELYSPKHALSLLKNSVEADVHDLRNEIIFQVDQFGHSQPSPKDQTVLVLEVKEHVLKLA